jgi:hypothetical protein
MCTLTVPGDFGSRAVSIHLSTESPPSLPVFQSLTQREKKNTTLTNSPLTDGSVMGPLHSVSEYAIQWIKKMQNENLRSWCPRQDVTDQFNEHVQVSPAIPPIPPPDHPGQRFVRRLAAACPNPSVSKLRNTHTYLQTNPDQVIQSRRNGSNTPSGKTPAAAGTKTTPRAASTPSTRAPLYTT